MLKAKLQDVTPESTRPLNFVTQAQQTFPSLLKPAVL